MAPLVTAARPSRAPSGHRARLGHDLPPGPALGALTQGTWLHRDPAGMVARLQARHGDVFTLRLPVEGVVVVVCAPEAAAPLLEAGGACAHAGEGRQRLLGMVAKRSVLGADEAAHREARGRVASVFTREAIYGRVDEVSAIAAQHVAAWPRGRPFRLLPAVRALVDEVFARCVVGVRDAERARTLGALVQRMLWTPGNPPLSPPGPDDGALGQLGKVVFARRAAPVRELLAGELERRGRAHRDDGPRDLLGVFAASGLPADDALDELLPLLMAGQEPPAAGLTWLLDRLARTPDAAAVVAEDPTGDEADAIRRETLRLTPAVAAIMRRVMTPTRVAGVELPVGTMTMLPIAWHHRDPRVWGSDADAFRPARFGVLGDEEAPPQLFPFGGGERRCLGEHLAHLEMDVVLPTVLRALDVRPLWPRPERPVIRGTVLVPHRSTPVVVSPR